MCHSTRHHSVYLFRHRSIVPHGGCDLPALFTWGCIELRHMSSLGHIVERCGRSCLKGVPRQETYKRGTSYLFNICSLDTLSGAHLAAPAHPDRNSFMGKEVK